MTTKLSGRQFKPLISDKFFLSVSDDRSHVILELFSVFAHKKSSTCLSIHGLISILTSHRRL